MNKKGRNLKNVLLGNHDVGKQLHNSVNTDDVAILKDELKISWSSLRVFRGAFQSRAAAD